METFETDFLMDVDPFSGPQAPLTPLEEEDFGVNQIPVAPSTLQTPIITLQDPFPVPIKQEPDDKKMKREKANRESAATSRQRKRNHVALLEERVEYLQREYTSNYIGLVRAQAENAALRRELESVQALIRDSPVLTGLLGVFARTTTASLAIARNIGSVAFAAAAAGTPARAPSVAPRSGSIVV